MSETESQSTQSGSQSGDASQRLSASVDRLKQEFDRWLDVAMEQGGRALDAFGFRGMSSGFCPAIDVEETTEDVRVTIDVPGVDPMNIDLTLQGNMLTVKGMRPSHDLVSDADVHLSERAKGGFQRSIPMPAPVDADAVSAETKNGVLSITLPKTAQARPRTIHVSMPDDDTPATTQVRTNTGGETIDEIVDE